MRKTILLFTVMLGLSACSSLYEQDPRSVKTEWQDNQLTVQIAGISNKSPFYGNMRLNAVSYDGNVVLMGQSRTEELKRSIVEQVRLMQGVKKVYDQIHVKKPITLTQVSKDSWITTKVKTSLLAKKQLINTDIKVITEDGEVFLFGYVTPEQAKNATEIARNIDGVKRVVQAWFNS